MDKVRLNIKSVLSIADGDDTALITLVDEAEERQVSILCDRATVERFEYRTKHRAESQKLIPEALSAVVRMKGGSPLEILIIGLYDGQYQVVLNARDLSDFVPIRASEAILLSMVANIPIYIEANLMKLQAVPYKKNETGIPLPMNVLSLDMLKKAMKQAVEDENYELASHLRDELKKRDNIEKTS